MQPYFSPTRSILSQSLLTIISSRFLTCFNSLIFNSKGRDGDIHLIANRNVAIASNYSVTLEAGETGVINLGEADATNPVLKGKEARDL